MLIIPFSWNNKGIIETMKKICNENEMFDTQIIPEDELILKKIETDNNYLLIQLGKYKTELIFINKTPLTPFILLKLNKAPNPASINSSHQFIFFLFLNFL